MNTKASEEPLFKFVTIRQVRTANTEMIDESFTAYGDAPPLPYFHQQMLDMGGVEDRTGAMIGLAQEYVASEDFVTALGSAPNGGDIAVEIRILLEIVPPGHDADQIQSDLENLLDESLADYADSAEFAARKEKLWSSLYAVYWLQDQMAMDQIVNAIQVTHLLEKSAADPNLLQDEEQRLLLLDATPLLPKDVFDFIVPQPPATESAGSGTEILAGHAVSEAQLRQEISGVTQAIRELEDVEAQRLDAFNLASEERLLAAAEREPLPEREEDFEPSGDPDRPARREETPSTRVVEPDMEDLLPPWRLSSADAGRLSVETRALLKEVGVPLDTLVLPHAVEALERYRSQHLIELHSKEVPQEVHVVGSVLLTSDNFPGREDVGET